MSKVVRWRGKFADINNKQYAVDIYGEGDAQTAVKVIVLGENPLTTEEDDNDDLFTPVRTQTGTLEVLDPDGTLMEEMLPSDNLDHPVRVYEVATGKVVWQGFLSCEAYSQDYTARAQVVELNLLGVLEAAKSIKLDVHVGHIQGSALAPIHYIIGHALNQIRVATDSVIQFNKVCYTHRTYMVLLNVLSLGMFHDVSESQSGFATTYSDEYDSLYDIIEKIAKSFCWCVRERGGNIYFGEPTAQDWYEEPYDIFVNDQDGERIPYGEVVFAQMPIANLNYNGTGHQKSTISPARSVVASGSPDREDELVSMPSVEIADWVDGMHWLEGSLDERKYLIMRRPTEMFLQSNVILREQAATYALNGTNEITMRHGGAYGNAANNASFTSSTSKQKNAVRNPSTQYEIRSGAYMVKRCIEKGDTQIDYYHKYDTAIYCAMIPKNQHSVLFNQPILEVESRADVFLGSDVTMLLKIKPEAYCLRSGGELQKPDHNYRLFCSIKFTDTNGVAYYYDYNYGDSYWISGEEIQFRVEFDKDGNMKYQPTSRYVDSDGEWVIKNSGIEQMIGKFTIMIWPTTEDMTSNNHAIYDVFITDLSLKIAETKSRNDTKEVTSMATSSKSGSDDVEIDLPVVSDQGYPECKNVIRDTHGSQTHDIYLFGTTSRTSIESAAASHVAGVVCKSRVEYDLEVERLVFDPNTTVISFRSREGDEYGRIVSESIDWRMNSSTIKIVQM